ncbi:hypothetical protein IG631_01159 [Alternaria alternata]|nr:hypothetical protein IG631_01159 [Alternaria alternata]
MPTRNLCHLRTTRPLNPTTVNGASSQRPARILEAICATFAPAEITVKAAPTPSAFSRASERSF